MMPPAKAVTRLSVAVGVGFVLISALVRADTIHTKGGDKIEGEIIEDRGDSYRVRVSIGVVDIDKADIEIIEKTPSPWERYEQKAAECPNTAEDHYRLACWCEEQGLTLERKKHLDRVISLDSDHGDARSALGYVKKDGAWVKALSDAGPTAEERLARLRVAKIERASRQRIAEWFLNVKAIYRGNLAGNDPQSKEFRRGRDRLLDIHDPQAIPALTNVLCQGVPAVRMVLVESLAQFNEDEATLNLIVVALLDPAAEVRKQAAIELLPRHDDRIVRELRSALQSDEEKVLRSAAAALGVLKAREAVPDLIPLLSTEQKRVVLVSRPVLLDDMAWLFVRNRHHRGPHPGRHGPVVGVLCAGTAVGTDYDYEVQTVSIYRTEVQEALIAITGQNFGFDGQAWLLWLRQQQHRK